MVQVYNGSKFTEKKYDSVEQLTSKLGVDTIDDAAAFRKHFEKGTDLFVFTNTEDVEYGDEPGDPEVELIWKLSADEVKTLFLALRDEV